MAETRTKDIREQDAEKAQERGKRIQPVHDQLKQAAEPEDSQGKQALAEMPVTEQASLVRNPQVFGAQRAKAMLNLQQTYGNRYVQRLAEGSKQATLDEETIRRIEARRGSGQPLEPGVRSQMEGAFGHNFGDVKIHTGVEANALSQQLEAKAFTTGKDIFFREGAYEPDSDSGKGLIAHELTHVVQQGVASSFQIQRQTAPSTPTRYITFTEEEAGVIEVPRPTSSEEAGREGGTGSEQEYIEFTHEGQTYRMTLAERDTFIRHLIKDKLGPFTREIMSKVSSARILYDHFAELNNEQYIVSWFAELLGGADMPAEEIILNAEAAAKRVKEAMAGTDFNEATEAIKSAEPIVNKAINSMNEYRSRVISGAGIAVTTLEITKTASFTIVCVLGGAALAAPVAAGGAGLGVVTSGAIMGGGTALLESVSTSTGEAVAGFDVSIGEAALKALKKTALGAIGGGLGAGIASRLSGPVVNGLYKSLGSKMFVGLSEEAAKKIIANSFEGGVSNAIQGALIDIEDMITGETTWEDLVQNIVVNLIAGGAAGAIQGRIPIRRGT